MRDTPGIKEFKTEHEAVEFAKERVAEHWVVHCYGPIKDWWVVDWWCQ